MPSSALMAPMSRNFVEGIEQFAAAHGVDRVAFKRGERKATSTSSGSPEKRGVAFEAAE